MMSSAVGSMANLSELLYRYGDRNDAIALGGCPGKGRRK
jgi:hypothetical protein